MNNNDYYNKLQKHIETMESLRAEGKTIGKGIIGESLLKDDLFFCAALDRSLRLIDGVKILLEERNLTCSGALLRLEMDNCMRTYAAFIAENRDEFFDCVIDGTRINKLRDKAGKQMKDCHLKTELSKIDRTFKTVYDQASGFIHLSEKAFFQMVDECLKIKTGDSGKSYTVKADVKWIYERTKILYDCSIDTILRDMLGFENYSFS